MTIFFQIGGPVRWVPFFYASKGVRVVCWLWLLVGVVGSGINHAPWKSASADSAGGTDAE